MTRPASRSSERRSPQMPVNQNLVTIQANPQMGVRGTLAPPCDIRLGQLLGQTFWDHSSSQGGWYSISDSAGHSHYGRLGGEGDENRKDISTRKRFGTLPGAIHPSRS